MTPERRITHLSIWTNLGLAALKLAAGLLGRSQALVADAVHSLSDFATDFAVLVGLRDLGLLPLRGELALCRDITLGGDIALRRRVALGSRFALHLTLSGG